MNKPPRSWVGRCAGLAFACLPLTALWSAQVQAQAPPQPKSIIELQAARLVDHRSLDGAGEPGASATLVNLNPAINASFLLTLKRSDQAQALNYHLENADPAHQRLSLDASQPGQLTIEVSGQASACDLWRGDALEAARRSKLPFAPLCSGRLYLRNVVAGNRSTLEATTEFLRDHVWRGEQIIGFVRREFYRDAFIERAGPASASQTQPEHLAPTNAPAPARMASAAVPKPLVAEGLGIGIGTRGGVLPGQWYAAAGLDHVFVSVAQPGALAEGDSAATGRGRALDAVEANALAYLVAFDLSAFELGFALGTEHPRLNWSARVPQASRDARLPGPDGIGNAAPLARSGMVNPALQARVVATFTGGFKREHGAFRYGELAQVNHGSHYGFIEQGVVYSSLVPGLSTLYVLNDGSIDMKSWRAEDSHLLGQIRHARQNGVPLIERGPAGGPSVYGALVDAWGPGNWSGSADEKLRSLRAGACLIEQVGRRHLVYGYFSTATPRAMARVFHAYGCGYAMHLDMNALEHTYLALYPRSGSRVGVEHLVQGMAALDKQAGNAWVPRFLGFADDRDFFYVMRKEGR